MKPILERVTIARRMFLRNATRCGPPTPIGDVLRDCRLPITQTVAEIIGGKKNYRDTEYILVTTPEMMVKKLDSVGVW